VGEATWNARRGDTSLSTNCPHCGKVVNRTVHIDPYHDKVECPWCGYEGLIVTKGRPTWMRK